MNKTLTYYMNDIFDIQKHLYGNIKTLEKNFFNIISYVHNIKN